MANIVTKTSQTKDTPKSLQTWWQSLTKPSDALTDRERERASSLAALCLVFIPLAIMVSIFGVIANSSDLRNLSSPETIASIVAILLVAISYGFSRTRYFMIGAYFVSLSAITAIIPIIFVTNEPIPHE
ncbi:MAG: hypothetical protein AAF126_25680, partial [Chloroflexota bacterium]